MKIKSPQISVEETTLGCRKIGKDENVVISTNFHSVQRINLADNSLPSIDNSDSIGHNNLNIRNLSKIPNEPKDWKREKTYDGSPVYRVVLKFCFYIFS